jgi:hypothetical protein
VFASAGAKLYDYNSSGFFFVVQGDLKMEEHVETQ